jgi:hypothetical protein
MEMGSERLTLTLNTYRHVFEKAERGGGRAGGCSRLGCY